jgi:hypothetical protein
LDISAFQGLSTSLSDRELWRDNFFYTLSRFADLEVQKSEWLLADSGEPYDCYEDLMESYRDLFEKAGPDSLFTCFEAGLLTVAEQRILDVVHRSIISYRPPKGAEQDVQKILSDQEWQNIVSVTHEARKGLIPLISDVSELEALGLVPA